MTVDDRPTAATRPSDIVRLTAVDEAEDGAERTVYVEFNQHDGEIRFGDGKAPVMPWGKFRDVPLSEVPMSYLGFVLEQSENLRPHLRAAVEREVLRRVMISMHAVTQQDAESLFNSNARHERADDPDAPGFREACVQFAYALLRGDMVAVDVFREAIERG